MGEAVTRPQLSESVERAYLVHISDAEGPLFYVRLKPSPEIWLRDGATASDVAQAVAEAHAGTAGTGVTGMENREVRGQSGDGTIRVPSGEQESKPATPLPAPLGRVVYTENGVMYTMSAQQFKDLCSSGGGA